MEKISASQWIETKSLDEFNVSYGITRKPPDSSGFIGS